MFCPQCGSPTKDGAKFCPKCGAMLTVEEAEAQAPQTESPIPVTPVDVPAAEPVIPAEPVTPTGPEAAVTAPETDAPVAPEAPDSKDTAPTSEEEPARSEEPLPAPEAPAGEPAPAPEEDAAPDADPIPDFKSILSGGAVSAAEAAEPPAAPGWEPPAPPTGGEPPYTPGPSEPFDGGEPPKKKSRKGLIAAVAVVAVLAVVGTAIGVTSLLSSDPKAYSIECLSGTFKELAAQEDALGLGDILASSRTSPTRQELSIKLGELPQELMNEIPAGFESFITDSKIEMAMESNLANRKLGMELTGNLGQFRPGSVQLFLDDATLSIGSPELTGGTFYGVNTETLGRDWAAADYGDSSLGEDFGFNFFDYTAPQTGAEDGETPALFSEDTEISLKEFYDTFYEAITVEKGEKTDADVNGHSVSCQVYTMTIPASAAREYLYDAVRAIAKDSGLRGLLLDAMRPALEEAGYYQDYEDMLDESVDQLLAQFKTALKYLKGDVTADLYISDKRVVRAEVSAKFADENDNTVNATLTVELGDGDVLGNALTAELLLKSGSDKIKIAFTSEGDHMLNDGKYTDETSLSVSSNGQKLMALDLSTELDTKRTEDNFSFNCTITPPYGSAMAVDLEGTVLISKGAGTFSADLDRIALSYMDESFSLAGRYSIAPLTSFSFKPADPKMILSMDTAELMGLYSDLTENLTALEGRFYDTYPDLRPFDAAQYLQGYLNACYLGKTDAYFEANGGLAYTSVEELYEQHLNDAADDFIRYCNMESVTEAERREVVNLFKDIYALSRFEAVSSYENYTDDYNVYVDVESLELYTPLTDAYSDFINALNAQFPPEDTDDMDYYEYEEWYETVYCPAYNKGIIDLARTVLSQAEYDSVYSTTVNLWAEGDTYTISSSDLSYLDDYIVE